MADQFAQKSERTQPERSESNTSNPVGPTRVEGVDGVSLPKVRAEITPAAGAKGIGAPEAVRQEGFGVSMDPEIRQIKSDQREIVKILKEDFGVELRSINGKDFLYLTKDDTRYPITSETSKVDFVRTSNGIQVNVTDKPDPTGKISVSRIAVTDAGKHQLLEPMSVELANGLTTDELSRLGMELDPGKGTLAISGRTLVFDSNTSSIKISYNSQTQQTTVTARDLETQDGITPTTHVVIDRDRQMQNIVLGKEKNGLVVENNRTVLKTDPTTSAEVKADALESFGSLASLKPGESFEGQDGRVWIKDERGVLFYNSNPAQNDIWGRLDSSLEYSRTAEGFKQLPENAAMEQEKNKEVNYDLTDYDDKNVAQILNSGFADAQKYAEDLGYRIGYKASGVFAKGIGGPEALSVSGLKPASEVVGIELQDVYLARVDRTGSEIGAPVKIGAIDLQESHSSKLRTPEHIFRQVKEMIDRHRKKP